MSGLHKTFDYVVPGALAAFVRIGTQVRVPLHGRRVGGWVVAVGDLPPEGVELKPIAKITGWGPPAEVIETAQWAAWRWAGPVRSLLRAASPLATVAGLPPPARPSAPVPVALDPLGTAAIRRGQAVVVRLPPAADPIGIVLAAAATGDTLVIVPSVAMGRLLGTRIRRAGVPVAVYPRDWAQAAAGAAVVIGARAAAWAPMPALAAVVVLDEHDESLQGERSPTWHAREVALERARRAGAPCVLVSPVPTLEALRLGAVLTVSRGEEREGWPVVEVVDRSRDEPWNTSLLSSPLLRHISAGRRVVCVLNTKGRARLLACATCRAIARCEVCEAAVTQPDDALLRCGRCGAERPVVCSNCGGGRFRALRPGVARLRDELAAASRSAVVEVTAVTAGEPLADAAVYVGTEAVLHQVPAADVVAYLDFDAELLAPRYRAGEQALGLLARGARLVGGRQGGGRLLVQTHLPHHEVIQAALLADPGRLALAELARREALRFPPATALASVSGPAAGEYIASLGAPVGVEVLGPSSGMWLVRAPDHVTLCDAPAAVERPAGRVRVEVDPLRV